MVIFGWQNLGRCHFFLSYISPIFCNISVMVNFTHQCDWVAVMHHGVARYLVKNYSGCFCEGVLDETGI